MASEISRRALLIRSGAVLVVAAGAAIGLTRTVHHKVAVPPPPPPVALTGGLAMQEQVLAGYEALAGGSGLPDGFDALHSDVIAHGDALRGLLQNYPGWRLAQATAQASGSAIPSDSPTPSGNAETSATAQSVADLSAQTKTFAEALSTDVIAWPAGDLQAINVVPVLGSIAACLQTHVEILT
jgi:hypothetical protein